MLAGALPVAGGHEWEPGRAGGRSPRLCRANGLKLGQVAQPLRAALTGKTTSPPLFAMLAAARPRKNPLSD